MKSKTDYSLRKFRIQTPKAITFLLLFFMLGGPIVFTACQPKTCPANSTQQFNRKRARYSMINHMRRRGGKGHKQRKSKHLALFTHRRGLKGFQSVQTFTILSL
ncbi:MAG: hypothetical protein ACPGLV_14240, partial [Bacteroidia bacterium]